MRINPSSSLLLATLAVSSSSSTLAAPTEPGPLERSSLHSSSSLHALALAGPGHNMDIGAYADRHNDNAVGGDMHVHVHRQLEFLLPTLEGLPIVGDILGPLLQKILNILGLHSGSAAGAESVSPTRDQLSAIQRALAEAHTNMNEAVNGDSSGKHVDARRIVEWAVVGNTPAASTANPSSDSSYTYYNSTSTMMASTPWMERAQSAPVTAASNATTTSSNGTNPTSPPLPQNPPNSPVVIPIAPKAPVAGLHPPALKAAVGSGDVGPGNAATASEPVSSTSTTVMDTSSSDRFSSTLRSNPTTNSTSTITTSDPASTASASA